MAKFYGPGGGNRTVYNVWIAVAVAGWLACLISAIVYNIRCNDNSVVYCPGRGRYDYYYNGCTYVSDLDYCPSRYRGLYAGAAIFLFMAIIPCCMIARQQISRPAVPPPVAYPAPPPQYPPQAQYGYPAAAPGYPPPGYPQPGYPQPGYPQGNQPSYPPQYTQGPGAPPPNPPTAAAAPSTGPTQGNPAV